MRHLRLHPLLIPVLAALVATGCGGGDKEAKTTKADSATSKTPAPLKAGGSFVVCTDVPYAPAEFIDEKTNEYDGYEIDVMNEVAKRLDTTAKYEKTLFDAIIPSLQSKKCDAIISSMNVTPEREKQVMFVKYMEIGQSLLVAAGKADGITSLEDLGGKVVAVQVGTTLKDAVEATSKKLVAGGGKAIDVQVYPDAGAAAAALKTGKVDAFFADSPIVADLINKDADSFEFAGEPIDPLPVGIAMRTADMDLHTAVQDAVDAMYEDGTMLDILGEWNVKDFALAGEGATA